MLYPSTILTESGFLSKVKDFITDKLRLQTKFPNFLRPYNKGKIVIISNTSHFSRVRTLKETTENKELMEEIIFHINNTFKTNYSSKDIIPKFSYSKTECSFKIKGKSWNLLKLAVKPEITYTYTREIVVVYFLISLLKGIIDHKTQSLSSYTKEDLFYLLENSNDTKFIVNGCIKNKNENMELASFLYGSPKLDDYFLCAKEIYKHIPDKKKYIIHYNSPLVRKMRNTVSVITGLHPDKWCPADIYLFERGKEQYIQNILKKQIDIYSINQELSKISIPVSLKEKKSLHGSLSLNVGFHYLLTRDMFLRYMSKLQEYDLNDKKIYLNNILSSILNRPIKDKLFIKIDGSTEVPFIDLFQRNDYSIIIQNFLRNERGNEVYNTLTLLTDDFEMYMKDFYTISSSQTRYSMKHLKVDYEKEKLKSIQPIEKCNIEIEKIIIPLTSNFVTTRIYIKVNNNKSLCQIRSKHNDGILYFIIVK